MYKNPSLRPSTKRYISPEIGYRRLVCKVLFKATYRCGYYLRIKRTLKSEDIQEVEELIYFFDHHFKDYLELLDIKIGKNPFLEALRDKYVFKKEINLDNNLVESLDSIENMLK